MLHACVQRFDVTGNLEKFGILGATEQAFSLYTQDFTVAYYTAPIYLIVSTTISSGLFSCSDYSKPKSPTV
jgi:hypothetical protein